MTPTATPPVPTESDPPTPGRLRAWWSGPMKRHRGLMFLGGAVVLALALHAGSPDAQPNSAEFEQVKSTCTATAGAQWVHDHPGSGNSQAEVRSFAGSVNRCIIDTLDVNPSYIPGDQPIAGYRS